jgi:hypothetical protein
MTNTLAYFIAVVIVAVKSFVEHDPGDQKTTSQSHKILLIVIDGTER